MPRHRESNPLNLPNPERARATAGARASPTNPENVSRYHAASGSLNENGGVRERHHSGADDVSRAMPL